VLWHALRAQSLRPAAWARLSMRWLLCELARVVPYAVLSPSVRVVLARLPVWLAGVRWTLGRGRPEELSALWNRISRYGRLRYIVQHLAQTPAIRSAAMDCDMSRAEEARLVGFHSPEAWNGQVYRWAEPVAAVAVSLPPGDYHVTVDTGHIRDAATVCTGRFFWNGHPVPSETVRYQDGCLVFPIHARWFRAQDPQMLWLLCAPLHAAADSRRLGLPVCAVRFMDAGAARRRSTADGRRRCASERAS